MKKKYLIKFLSFILAMILFFTDITAYASNMVPQTISGNTLSGNSMPTNTFSMNQIPEKPVYTPYWDGEGNFSNLIIFVEFADTLEEHSYDSECIKLFEDDSEDGRGLRDYFYDVSKGKMKIETIIPQYDTENEEIVALTLKKSKSEYIVDGVFDEMDFLRDVTEELNNSVLLLDEMNLHCSNSESTIADYLTIIVPEDADDPEEIVTSHNGVCESEEILLDENIVHKYDLIIEDDLKSENAEQMLNNLFWEYLGYRNYTGNAEMLYPTADFLASHLSWFEIPELTESQLSYVLTDSDAVILKTALSDTEYFIIEYRQDLSEDEGISDLLIYRVDTEVVFGGGKESERIETIPYGEKMLYTNGDKSNIALKNVMVTEDNKISIDIIFGNPEKKIVGWQEENGRYCYYNQEGKKQKGIVKIDGKNYYFDDNYQLTTGWKKISGKYRFFNNSSDYKKCYELSYTGKVGGWITLSDGRKSYITSKKGIYKGLKTISDRKYYFDSAGIMKKNYWKKSGNYYYYAGSDGSMVKGVKKIGTKKYYFDSDCRLSTGWKKISGKYRFFNDASNYKNRYELTYTDKGNSGGWVTLSDGRKSYISTKKGVLKGWQTISGKKYYFSSKGIRQSGWQTIDGKKYFFNLSGVYMSMGKTSITSVTSTTYGKAKIQWKKVSYVDDYVLQYSTSSKFKSGSTKTIKLNDVSSTTYTLDGLKGNKTYYFRIRYTAEGGKKSDPETAKSKYSAAKSVKVKGEVKATSTSAKITSCKITAGSKAQGITIYFKAKLSDRLKSADKKYYIVQTESYGTNLDVKTPRAIVDKDFTVKVKFDIAAKDVTRALMDKYALAIKNSDGKYQLVSTPRALANPEFVAENTKAVLKTVSKKGIQGAGFADAADTNSKHTLFNLDLADIVSTKAKSGYVSYQYKGKTYYFSDCSGLKWELQQMARGYDQYIQGMTGKKTKISVTMCILLSYKSSTSFLIDKAARTKGHTYYMLNVREEKARETLEAVFLYLGEIFGQEDCYVTNWVLGNEVNSSRAWNYSGSLSQSQYMKCYASAFRLLYNGVKASKTGNNVHISLDNGWCAAPDTYTGKSTLDKFASYAHKENPSMIWGIAYHGYSYPLTINDFWKDTTNTTSKSSTKYISMKNISVLTKYAASLEKKYEKPSGSIRVILSEQGYNAGKGSYSQAYALARGYYMAEFNSRIDAFIIRALQDAKEETKGGLYFGIKNRYEEKRTSYYVYENMDSDLTKFGKKKASTYVSSANVNKFKEAQKVLYKIDWADIIPKFKKSKLEGMY